MDSVAHALLWLFPTCLVVGGYVAWNIGANDVSNAMGTSVGSKTLTMKQAVLVAAIFEFIGAAFFGTEVSETLQDGLFDASFWSNQALITTKGMLASLLAAGVWLHFASLYKLPVSTTHSIVGAIVGFAIIAGGIDAVHWGKVAFIGLSWIVSPLLGGVAAFLAFSALKKFILSKPEPLEKARKLLPIISFLSIFCIGITWLVIDRHEPSIQEILIVLLLAGGISLIIFGFAHWITPKESSVEKEYAQAIASFVLLQQKKRRLLIEATHNKEAEEALTAIEEEISALTPIFQRRTTSDQQQLKFKKMELLFGLLQVLTACLMAFSHGSNDVANAIGPLNACLSNLAQCGVSEAKTFLPYTLPLGGFFIVIGLATWGWRVIETIGSGITDLTPSRGFAAEFGASATILLASKLGLPISTTHTLVGAVIGVGFAGGFTSINMQILRDIVTSWFVTIPAGALLSIIFFYLFSLI